MAADMLKIKKGLVASLPKTKAPGTIYVATDEKTMYIDISNDDTNGRIRISGNLIMVENATDLKAPFSEDLIYFVENFTKEGDGSKIAANALLKWTGKEFVQLNKAADFTGVQNDIVNAQAAADKAQKAADDAQKAADDAQKTADDAVTSIEAAKTTIADHGTRLTAVEEKADDNAEAIKTATGNITTVTAKTDKNAEDIATLTETVSENKTDIESKLAAEIKAREDADTAINTLLGTKGDSASAEGSAFAQIAALKAQDTALEGKIDTNEESIGTLNGELTQAKGDITAVSSRVTTNENDIKTIKEALGADGGTGTSLTSRVGALETAVNGHSETLTTHGESIDNNATAIKDLASTVEENKTTAASDLAAAKKELAAADTATNEAVTALTNRVKTNEDTIKEHTESIDALDTKIDTDIAAAKTELTTDLNNKVNAVNAMTYKGTVAKVSELPSTNVSIGDVYVFNANELDDAGEKVHTAGDMAIAYSTAGDAGEEDNVITTGLDWHFVETGYQHDQENQFVGEGNELVLKSFLGEKLGQVSFAGVADKDSGIAATINENIVTLSFQWGEF